MKQVLPLFLAVALSSTALGNPDNEASKNRAMPDMGHGDVSQNHRTDHDHDHDHENKNQDSLEHHDHSRMSALAPKISQTDDISSAIAVGGTPVVVDVLGVVCDFCAMAMNKIFGKREEVAAIYVDLDQKTLNLVVHQGSSLSDTQIEKLAEKAGYRVAGIRRNSQALDG